MNTSSSLPAKGKVVRAIDVGFGLVKFTMRGPDGGITCSNFPSMALPASDRFSHLPGVMARATFDVPVNDKMFEVGPDVIFAQAANEYGRDISDDFYRSDVYYALTKGALRLMANAGDTEIDMLVLGLPVNQFVNVESCEYLRRQYFGDIDLGDGKAVTIKAVTVQAQPMGAFIDLAQRVASINDAIAAKDPERKPISSISELNLLIVDPGEFTLDWMLFREGRLDVKSSGATSDAGRDRVIRAVKKSLEAKIAMPLSQADSYRINKCLRLREKFRYQGTSYSLEEYEEIAMNQVSDSLGTLLNGISAAGNNIDLMVFVGGHPDPYQKLLSKRFPNIPTLIIDQSIDANVRGFQILGEGSVGEVA